MSVWHEVKLEDLELNGDELLVCLEPDNYGNIYVQIKLKDVIQILLQRYTIIKNLKQ